MVPGVWVQVTVLEFAKGNVRFSVPPPGRRLPGYLYTLPCLKESILPYAVPEFLEIGTETLPLSHQWIS